MTTAHHPLSEYPNDALARAEILYTDLDGTLLARGGSILADAQGAPSAVTATAIARLNAAGLPVVMCSGRNQLQLFEMARLLGWSGFIAEVGCVIVPERGAEPVYYTGEWPQDALRANETPFEAIARVGALDVLWDAFPGTIEHHTPYDQHREATYVLRGNVDIATVSERLGSLELPVALIDNGIIHPPTTTLSNVTEVHAYHLLPAGVSKASAVAHDLERRGLTRDQALSIGDSVTDIAMAASVGLGVLVANALQDPRVCETLEHAPGRTASTQHARGEGWAELANAWLAARALAGR